MLLFQEQKGFQAPFVSSGVTVLPDTFDSGSGFQL